MISTRPFFALLWLWRLHSVTPALAPALKKAIVVTGANKGQGFALCQRILEEHSDTYVFLCARDITKGVAALQELGPRYADRACSILLDVTDRDSVQCAAKQISETLGDNKLYGCVSNAGILWGHSLEEQFQVNARGVRSVLDAFVPLMDTSNKGRMVVVSSGLGPLMHAYASDDNKAAMNKKECKWDDLEALILKCLRAVENEGGLEDIGFSGGPFAEAVPDFHLYGLAKMMADAYMKSLGRQHPELQINSCDPGLVYTDLILKMPKYEGQSIDECSGAQTPKQGVEAAIQLLFDNDIQGSGHFYAMSKDNSRLLKSTIDVKPVE